MASVYSYLLLSWKSCTFSTKFFHKVVCNIPLHNSLLTDQSCPIIFPNLPHLYREDWSSGFHCNVSNHLKRYMITPKAKTFQCNNYVNYITIFNRKCCFCCRRVLRSIGEIQNDNQRVINAFPTYSTAHLSPRKPYSYIHFGIYLLFILHLFQ